MCQWSVVPSRPRFSASPIRPWKSSLSPVYESVGRNDRKPRRRPNRGEKWPRSAILIRKKNTLPNVTSCIVKNDFFILFFISIRHGDLQTGSFQKSVLVILRFFPGKNVSKFWCGPYGQIDRFLRTESANSEQSRVRRAFGSNKKYVAFNATFGYEPLTMNQIALLRWTLGILFQSKNKRGSDKHRKLIFYNFFKFLYGFYREYGPEFTRQTLWEDNITIRSLITFLRVQIFTVMLLSRSYSLNVPLWG